MLVPERNTQILDACKDVLTDKEAEEEKMERIRKTRDEYFKNLVNNWPAWYEDVERKKEQLIRDGEEMQTLKKNARTCREIVECQRDLQKFGVHISDEIRENPTPEDGDDIHDNERREVSETRRQLAETMSGLAQGRQHDGVTPSIGHAPHSALANTSGKPSPMDGMYSTTSMNAPHSTLSMRTPAVVPSAIKEPVHSTTSMRAPHSELQKASTPNWTAPPQGNLEQQQRDSLMSLKMASPVKQQPQQQTAKTHSQPRQYQQAGASSTELRGREYKQAAVEFEVEAESALPASSATHERPAGIRKLDMKSAEEIVHSAREYAAKASPRTPRGDSARSGRSNGTPRDVPGLPVIGERGKEATKYELTMGDKISDLQGPRSPKAGHSASSSSSTSAQKKSEKKERKKKELLMDSPRGDTSGASSPSKSERKKKKKQEDDDATPIYSTPGLSLGLSPPAAAAAPEPRLSTVANTTRGSDELLAFGREAPKSGAAAGSSSSESTIARGFPYTQPPKEPEDDVKNLGLPSQFAPPMPSPERLYT